MIYKMQQKFFALGHDFTIQDQNGQDVYEVDGKFISLGNKLAFRDMAGNELAYISQKLLAWGPTYEISRNGQTASRRERVAVHSVSAPFYRRRGRPE